LRIIRRSARPKFSLLACTPLIKRLAVFCRRLVALVHEVIGREWSTPKQIIPAPPNGSDDSAVANLENLDFSNIVRKRNGSREAYGLGAICNENN
jgi:hypothetical protein